MKPQEFLEFLVKELVEHPDQVKVTRTVDEMGVLLSLDIHPEDMGKVIGKSGRTAKAIRTMLRVVGMKHNARVNMKINEPEGYSKPTPSVSNNYSEEKASSVSSKNDDGSSLSLEMDQAISDLKSDFE